jgi:hypothetical protein
MDIGGNEMIDEYIGNTYELANRAGNVFHYTVLGREGDKFRYVCHVIDSDGDEQIVPNIMGLFFYGLPKIDNPSLHYVWLPI